MRGACVFVATFACVTTACVLSSSEGGSFVVPIATRVASRTVPSTPDTKRFFSGKESDFLVFAPRSNLAIMVGRGFSNPDPAESILIVTKCLGARLF